MVMRLTLDCGWEFKAVIDICDILCSGEEPTALGLVFLEACFLGDRSGQFFFFYSEDIEFSV